MKYLVKVDDDGTPMIMKVTGSDPYWGSYLSFDTLGSLREELQDYGCEEEAINRAFETMKETHGWIDVK